MTGARPANILRQLERPAESDAELLARFSATRDAGAFAELVRRHGPLVFGVCRRVTGHPQDAEDAFQATFLVLAKKAGSLRNPALLGNWLYGVAYRVARKAKRSALRRRAREVTMSSLPESVAPAPSGGWPELAPILDAELAALPAHYRDAIVLCDLRGTSREEASAALGIPEGTLSSRLANGRKKLAARLAKRGITLSISLLPAAVSDAAATASVPNELVAKTCGLINDWANGVAVPSPLARLAEGVFTMRTTVLMTAVLALAVGGAVLAARSDGDPSPSDPPKPPAVAQKPNAEPKPKEEPKPGEKGEGKYTNAPKLRVATDIDIGRVETAAWSRDGQFFAAQGYSKEGTKEEGRTLLLAIHKEGFTRVFSGGRANGDLVDFTPDSHELITEKREHHLVSGFHWLRFLSLPEYKGNELLPWRANTRTVNLDLPETHGYAFAPDGKTFRTVAYHRDSTRAVTKIEVLEVDAATGKAKESLLKIDHGPYALAPNGKRLAVLDKEYAKVTVYDLDRGAKQFDFTIAEGKFAELPPTSPSSGVVEGQRGNGVTMAFSPDARRLVVARAVGQTVVLNAETGEAMPRLEGANESRLRADPHVFTGDGRLLVMSGTVYKPGKYGEKEFAWEQVGSILTVWDTQSGKALKTWDCGRYRNPPRGLFNASKPVLAILEANGENQTRLGFWDFSAEAEKK